MRRWGGEREWGSGVEGGGRRRERSSLSEKDEGFASNVVNSDEERFRRACGSVAYIEFDSNSVLIITKNICILRG